jgi:hypothetical protein
MTHEDPFPRSTNFSSECQRSLLMLDLRNYAVVEFFSLWLPTTHRILHARGFACWVLLGTLNRYSIIYFFDIVKSPMGSVVCQWPFVDLSTAISVRFVGKQVRCRVIPLLHLP